MVRACAWCLGVFVLTTATTAAPEPAAKPVRDLWDAIYLDGNRTGYAHTLVEEVERDGKKILRTNLTLNLTLKRMGDTVQIHSETGTEETMDGKVTAVSMKQALGKEQMLALTGAVEGKQLHVKIKGKANLDRAIPWNSEVVGLSRELDLFKEKKSKPGDSFSYLHFEPTINSVVAVKAVVKEPEEIVIDKVKRKLLRAEAKPDKIGDVQLPGTTYWLDDDLQVIRSAVDAPGLGKMVLVRTTKQEALRDVLPAKIGDIGLTQLLPLNRRIDAPHESAGVVYKITLPGDDDPATAFASDNRQSVKNARGKEFELHVKALRQPPAKAPEGTKEPGEEYSKSNYYINSADAKVKEHAKAAVGTETDPWKKALRIEKWVKTNMKIQNYTEAMATADHVAKTLEGDCTEHAMLAAAMCRAANVPARTAIGLVYVDMRNQAVLGYHMWTEVWVRGEWLSLDATLGRGSVGPGHVKITDASWHDTQSLKPLLPVMRVMLGKPTIEVVRVSE